MFPTFLGQTVVCVGKRIKFRRKYVLAGMLGDVWASPKRRQKVQLEKKKS